MRLEAWAAALLISGAAAAQSPPPAPVATPAPPPLATADDAAAALALAAPKLQANDCAGVLAILDPLVRRLPPGDARQTVQRVRLSCLVPAGRPAAEVETAFEEISAADPREPGIRAFGVALAMDTHDYPLAAQRLAAAAEDEPAVLPRIQAVLVRALRQQIAADPAQKPLFDRLDLALAQAGWQSPEYPDLADSIRANAVQVSLKRGNVGGARVLLAQVEAPELLTDMAIERTYQPVWPEVAARLGPHGALAVDLFAGARLETYARQPGSDQAIADATRSFALLNRADDAAALGGQVAIADGMSEQLVDAVRYGADALAAAGHRDEALARLQHFETLDLGRTPSAVSGLVLYAELLDEAGQPERALAVATTTLARGAQQLSPWGVGWLKRSQACALAALGRADAAKAAGDALVGQADANPAAAIEGLLCLGRRDEAAKLAVTTLGHPDGADQLGDQFQPAGAFWLDHPSRLRALWQPLLARPDVKAAFDKVARILPRTLWPDPKPRDIPRDTSAPSNRGLA